MRTYYWAEIARKREAKKALERHRLKRDYLQMPFQPLLTSSGLVDLTPVSQRKGKK